MPATRRSHNVSPEKSNVKKAEVTEKPARKRKPVEDTVQEPVAETSNTRPKRTARKSVLLSSADFEVSYPGVKIEEPDEEDVAVSVPIHTPVRSPRVKKTRTDVISERSDVELDTEMDTTNIDSEQDLEADIKPPNRDVIADIDVETMSNLEDATDDNLIAMKDYSDGEYEEDDDQPPLLEKVSDLKRKRGRPRKHPIGQTPFRRTTSTTRTRPRSEIAPFTPVIRNRYTYEKPITKTEAEKINSFNVKLFEDEIGVTEHGDLYATVIPGCLSYLLRKERIIELLTNRSEISAIRSQGWVSKRSPRLPPLVTTKSCFAFYIEGQSVNSIRELSTDDLKPWTSSEPAEGEPVIKPNVRKHAIARNGGRLVPSRGDPRTADIHLTEYSAWLPRCLRLRKKIFYLARSGHIIGNVLILYDFTIPGEIPLLVNVIHGNEAFRHPMTDLEFEKGHLLFVNDNEDPFLEDIVPGPRGEKFLQVRPDKLGWTNNKKLLLKYLINDPQLLEQSSINTRIPFLPPLVETRGVFVHFAPSHLVADQIHFTGDGLSPWTFQGATVNHRVRTVKRALVQDADGVFSTSKEEWQTTGLALVETITILCRCPRLRKRIIYIQRNNSVVCGNVCFIYEYMRDGPVPEIVKNNPRAINGMDNGLYRDNTMRSSSDLYGVHKKSVISENGEEEVDVEELLEEEAVVDDMHLDHSQSMSMSGLRDHDISRLHEEYEELPEDSLEGGWDVEYDEDILTSQENPAPFFEGIRQLEAGHTYLTVRHKRVAGNLETVLEYIANSTYVEDKGLVNMSKPSHPPLVRNSRSYVFFVSASIIYPHDINRDDFSPWSANATPENPTCYRSKVRKVGVLCDPKTGIFSLQEGDYKVFPYHLVSLYSIHPKEARLRKRITYLMETDNKIIVSHVMIMYDYNSEGPIPHVNGPYGKRIMRRRPLRRMTDLALDTVMDDISDVSESEKDSPFSHVAQQNDDGTLYLSLSDLEFINDRNRQLHYLINKPHLLETLNCLNTRVPMFPPSISGKGAFVFFVDGGEVDVRNLTCDGLAPWSENMHMSDGTIMCRRPKSNKIPLGVNRDGQLRVLRGRKTNDPNEFVMHIYAATLPRLSRLKKRVMYISKEGQQIGHSMVIYWYSEPGEPPSAVAHGNAVHADQAYIRLAPSVREEAKRLLLTMTPVDAAKELTERHGIPVNARAIYNVKREMTKGVMPPHRYDVKLEGNYDIDDLADYSTEWLGDSRRDSIVDEGAIDVGHNEEVGESVRSPTRHRKSLTSGLSAPRAAQSEQVFRYAANVFGTRTENETFDALWRTMLQKNEQRILHNIKTDFGVEIVAEAESSDVLVDGDVIDDGTILHEEILDGEIVEEHVIDEDLMEEEVVMDMDMVDVGHVSDHEVIEEIVVDDLHEQHVEARDGEPHDDEELMKAEGKSESGIEEEEEEAVRVEEEQAREQQETEEAVAAPADKVTSDDGAQ